MVDCFMEPKGILPLYTQETLYSRLHLPNGIQPIRCPSAKQARDNKSQEIWLHSRLKGCSKIILLCITERDVESLWVPHVVLSNSWLLLPTIRASRERRPGYEHELSLKNWWLFGGTFSTWGFYWFVRTVLSGGHRHHSIHGCDGACSERLNLSQCGNFRNLDLCIWL